MNKIKSKLIKDLKSSFKGSEFDLFEIEYEIYKLCESYGYKDLGIPSNEFYTRTNTRKIYRFGYNNVDLEFDIYVIIDFNNIVTNIKGEC